MTALGASIGTGNIAGVATAIVTGGPGAIFWIWAYGFVATTIKFSEAVLGIQFRLLDGEQLSAGPMHYLATGSGCPGWAGSTRWWPGWPRSPPLPFTQPNSIAVVLQSEFGIPTWRPES